MSMFNLARPSAIGRYVRNSHEVCNLCEYTVHFLNARGNTKFENQFNLERSTLGDEDAKIHLREFLHDGSHHVTWQNPRGRSTSFRINRIAILDLKMLQ